MRNLKYFTLLLFAAVTIPALGENANEDEKFPEITFEKTTIDFGLFDRAHGDKTCWFVFTNTGEGGQSALLRNMSYLTGANVLHVRQRCRRLSLRCMDCDVSL